MVLTEQELQKLKFKKLGVNVQISSNASLYGCEYMEIGDNVQINDFCVLSGTIILENNTSILSHSVLISGKNSKITIKSNTKIGNYSKLFTKTDDYSGDYISNPTVPSEYTNVKENSIYIGKNSNIGINTIIMPGITIEDEVETLPNSVVNINLLSGYVYSGFPIKKIKQKEQ